MEVNNPSHYMKEYMLSTPPLHYRKEDIIIFPDRDPDGFYFIESGYVKAYTVSEEGEQHSRMTYKDGEYFPLLWAFKRIHPALYFQAQSDVVMHKISVEELNQLMNEKPEVAREMLMMVIEIYVMFATRLENLEIDSAYKRIVFRLLVLAKRFGTTDGNEVTLPVQFSHQDFAFSLNMARETASRQLQKLKQMGLISYQSKYITIHDLAKLREELE